MSQGEVASKAEAVTHLFDILLPIVPGPDQDTDPALHVSIEYEDQYGRFNIWVGNLGVFAKGHASLDYRLRDSPQQMTLLKELLDELQRLLLQGVLYIPPCPQPSSPFSVYLRRTRPCLRQRDEKSSQVGPVGFTALTTTDT